MVILRLLMLIKFIGEGIYSLLFYMVCMTNEEKNEAELEKFLSDIDRKRTSERLFTESEVLNVVDSCFHCYASYYRGDAEEYAHEIMNSLERVRMLRNELEDMKIGDMLSYYRTVGEKYIGDYEIINTTFQYDIDTGIKYIILHTKIDGKIVKCDSRTGDEVDAYGMWYFEIP
jgi:hypothetical protein